MNGCWASHEMGAGLAPDGNIDLAPDGSIELARAQDKQISISLPRLVSKFSNCFSNFFLDIFWKPFWNLSPEIGI